MTGGEIQQRSELRRQAMTLGQLRTRIGKATLLHESLPLLKQSLRDHRVGLRAPWPRRAQRGNYGEQPCAGGPPHPPATQRKELVSIVGFNWMDPSPKCTVCAWVGSIFT